MMLSMDVKRLAALDMWGTRGTARRRRIIVTEFIIGAIGGTAIGAWVMVAASRTGTEVFGAWIAAAALNYVPLSVYAIRLSRPGALDAELAGVDTGRELRRYSVLQVLLVVPLAFWVLSVLALARRRTAG